MSVRLPLQPRPELGVVRLPEGILIGIGRDNGPLAQSPLETLLGLPDLGVGVLARRVDELERADLGVLPGRG